MSEKQTGPGLSPEALDQMFKFITGKWLAKPLALAVELGLAEALESGPLSLEELAWRTGCHAPSLGRMLRALACLEIFRQTEDGRYELTPLARTLSLPPIKTAALMFNAAWNDAAWSELPRAIKTGRNAFELAHGQPLFLWLAENPQAAETLGQANAARARDIGRALVESYDFSGLKTLADLGGGSGLLLAALLRANPDLDGLLLELPHQIEAARQTMVDLGLADRCRVVSGDFFEAVPPGGQALLLANVLHDWSDAAVLEILTNCRQALERGGKLLVVELIVPPGNEPSVAKFLDLEMMVITGGRERTANQYTALLNQGGFQVRDIKPTPAGVSLIEAVAS